MPKKKFILVKLNNHLLCIPFNLIANIYLIVKHIFIVTSFDILVIDFFFFNNIFFFLKKQTHLYYYIHLSSKYDDLKRDTVNLKIPGSVWF